MPRHAEGYVSKRIAELTEDLKISVLDSAQIVHQMCSGSMDLDRPELAKHIEILKFYVDHWVTTGEDDGCGYDGSAHDLVNAAMCEWIEKKNSSPFDIDDIALETKS